MTPTAAALPAVLPTVRTLSRSDKLRLIEILARDLVQDEVPAVVPGAAYPVWTPFFTEQAAAIMLKELEKGRSQP